MGNILKEKQDPLLGWVCNPTVEGGRIHVERGSFEIDRIDGVFSQRKFNPVVHWLISMSFLAVPLVAWFGGSSNDFMVISLFVAAFLSWRTNESEPFDHREGEIWTGRGRIESGTLNNSVLALSLLAPM
jgi:hypothetical protein